MTPDEVITAVGGALVLLGIPLLLLRAELRLRANRAKAVKTFEHEASLRGEKILFIEDNGSLEHEARPVGMIALTDKRLVFRSIANGQSIDIPCEKIRGVREQSLLANGRLGGFALMMVKLVDGSEIALRVQGREKWMAAIRESRAYREVADDMH
jgi:hypothetical protein